MADGHVLHDAGDAVVQGQPVADLKGLGGADDDAAEQVRQYRLRGETGDGGQHGGSGEEGLAEGPGQGGGHHHPDHRDKDDHKADHVFQEAGVQLDLCRIPPQALEELAGQSQQDRGHQEGNDSSATWPMMGFLVKNCWIASMVRTSVCPFSLYHNTKTPGIKPGRGETNGFMPASAGTPAWVRGGRRSSPADSRSRWPSGHRPSPGSRCPRR